MANALFDAGKEGFLSGTIDWDADNIKATLIDQTDHTFNLSTDRDLADVTAAAIEETSGNLASKTVTDGVADAADVTFTSASGDACDEVMIYQDTGVSTTSLLIARWDTATGLPVTLNGGDVTVQWNASGLFSL
ncbi:MAG: hypothetical protein ACWGPR_08460 [Candidatus Deferrimicrobiaceae bacterium]